MSPESLKKVHKWALFVFLGPGMLISVLAVLFTGQKVILIWNLALSIYTILMEHALGWRQEQKDSE